MCRQRKRAYCLPSLASRIIDICYICGPIMWPELGEASISRVFCLVLVLTLLRSLVF